MPNDASNQARALLVLQSAGLIELEGRRHDLRRPRRHRRAASKVKVTALEAALTADVASRRGCAPIINNDFVEDAGLSFADAIAQDDPTDPNALPYVNIFAAPAEDADNETFQKLVEIYQTTQVVQDGVVEVSGDTAVLRRRPRWPTSSARSRRSRPTSAASQGPAGVRPHGARSAAVRGTP